jgi:hypothetical protein
VTCTGNQRFILLVVDQLQPIHRAALHTEFIPLLVLALSQSQRRQTLFQTLITSLLLAAAAVLNVEAVGVLAVC